MDAVSEAGNDGFCTYVQFSWTEDASETVKTQQTPKPEAHPPLEEPPRSSHSVEVKQVPLRWLPELPGKKFILAKKWENMLNIF